MTKPPQKYTVGEHVGVQGWVSSSAGTVAAIDWMFHIRMGEWVWGYKIDFDEGLESPLNFVFIPEGYLRKDA